MLSYWSIYLSIYDWSRLILNVIVSRWLKFLTIILTKMKSPCLQVLSPTAEPQAYPERLPKWYAVLRIRKAIFFYAKFLQNKLGFLNRIMIHEVLRTSIVCVFAHVVKQRYAKAAVIVQFQHYLYHYVLHNVRKWQRCYIFL
jgi:hypothetical protein